PTGDTDWDRFVETADPGSYLQLSGWARIKAVNGWSAQRTRAAGPAPIAAQILTRRPRPLPWAFAYAPRGPVATTWAPDAIAAFSDAARRERRKEWGEPVSKAGTWGVTGPAAGGSALPAFCRVCRETAARRGFLIRTEGAYRAVWEAFAPTGNARLLSARRPGGEALATLF